MIEQERDVRRQTKNSIGPQTALCEGASLLVRSRIRSVARLVKDISTKSVHKPEYVHQLRVAIRRADAAIDAFEGLFESGAAAEMRKRLRAVRKAAGAARDCDVHCSLLPPLSDSACAADRQLASYISSRLRSSRHDAAKRLLSAARPRKRRKLKSARVELLASITVPAPGADAARSPSLIEAAQASIAAVVLATREAASQNLGDLDQLHALRVDAKQVRYAVELFRVCLPAQLCDAALNHLREFQSLLGRVNDARQMASWLADEAVELCNGARPRGIPKHATPESIHEELRVLLGRFEAERDAAHAAAIPQIASKLDAALRPLEEWLENSQRPEAPDTHDRRAAGRSAEGHHDRNGSKRPSSVPIATRPATPRIIV